MLKLSNQRFLNTLFLEANNIAFHTEKYSTVFFSKIAMYSNILYYYSKTFYFSYLRNVDLNILSFLYVGNIKQLVSKKAHLNMRDNFYMLSLTAIL